MMPCSRSVRTWAGKGQGSAENELILETLELRGLVGCWRGAEPTYRMLALAQLLISIFFKVSPLKLLQWLIPPVKPTSTLYKRSTCYCSYFYGCSGLVLDLQGCWTCALHRVPAPYDSPAFFSLPPCQSLLQPAKLAANLPAAADPAPAHAR